MCGRFANDAETHELIAEFVAQGNDFREWRPQLSIAPTEVVPIVRERIAASGEIVRAVEPAEWDFRPAFVTTKGRPQFNARVETVASNGLWKTAFAASRCIVPMRGYYEWTGPAGDKQPYFLQGDRRILAAAGIATARKVDDVWVVSTAIITREAAGHAADVHTRMPAFLTADAYDAWLSPQRLANSTETSDMIDLLLASSDRVADAITVAAVDRRVNNSRAIDPRDPRLIEPLVAGAGS